MIAPTNEYGKLQTVSQVIVHYSAIPFVSPSVELTMTMNSDIDLQLKIYNLMKQFIPTIRNERYFSPSKLQMKMENIHYYVR